jgi:hypothetical protein
MSSPDIAFTIIVCTFFACFAAVRIARIIANNWKNM